MLESILPGLDLMMIGMSIVFSFLLLLIIATKLMSLIVGSVFDDTSLIKKVDTNGPEIISNQEKQIITEVLGLHKS
jgi:Na+-transporting methylmalonyl-CoA/oxaloacetate decarboxylase gamma subunit|tara:strand:- start:119 stop:346 length:228 start_codon:yes stop_codon:yes gene_type:complete